MIKTNFHTHTRYCDGKDTPEEIIEAALRLGFDTLGFSEHSHSNIEGIFGMTAENQENYIAEINALKEKYRGKIKILCGIEADSLANISPADFDFVISSVHYVKKGENCLSVDLSAEGEINNVNTFYGGDFDAFAEDYFDAVAEAAERIKPDIIGHLDLVMKFAEINGRVESPRYLAAAERCIKRLALLGIPFEINTGAMARGYRTAPYPSKALLKFIKQNGGSVIINSDCHDKSQLDFAFDMAKSQAQDLDLTIKQII